MLLILFLVATFSGLGLDRSAPPLPVHFIKDTTLYIKDLDWTGTIQFKRMKSIKGYKIVVKNSITKEQTSLLWRYDIFKLRLADIDGDGSTDLCMALLKETRFDPVMRRRLFLLRRDHNNLRPLWLGSRLCHTFVDFETIIEPNQPVRIRAQETDPQNQPLVGVYKWHNFGLSLLYYEK